jgi:hypothetical protein
VSKVKHGWEMVREYRRLRSVSVAQTRSYERLEAFGRAIANVESNRRLRGR